MSAIWGIIQKKECDHSQLVATMTGAMSRYKIDRIDTVSTSKATFACGHQYITPESLGDVSPIHDSDGIVFAADCFLYNREAIIEKIEKSAYRPSKSPEELRKAGDAELAYFAFKALGYNFAKELRGAFAFAIYDEKAEKLHLITEQLDKRYLCYYITEDYICFSSVLKNVMALGGDKLTVSRRFVTKTLLSLSPLNFFEPETTVFNEVKHLDAARHFTFDLTTGKIEKEQYWTPRTSVKKMKNMSMEECQKLFLDTFHQVTDLELRSIAETGIMLSGGLDSSSVLAMSAPTLQAQGKKIYSYTTTPCDRYKAEISRNYIENESFLVHEQEKRHPNLVPSFVNSDDFNCVTFCNQLQEILDIPVKTTINLPYILQMIKAAQKDNCKILLSGSNGNPTISYGSIGGYIDLAMRKGNFSGAFSEAKAYCKYFNISRKRYFKHFLKSRFEYVFKTRKDDISFLPPEEYKLYDAKNFRKREKKEFGGEFNVSEKQKRNFQFMPSQYIQKGYYYTVLGLEYGFLQIDPTLTVEMIELCMALPDECFCHNGIERYLVRGFMKDMLPELITDPRKGYGVQASDFDFRINEDWPAMKAEVLDLLNDPDLKKYVNEESLKNLLEDMAEHDDHLERGTCWTMSILASLGYFLRAHKRYL